MLTPSIGLPAVNFFMADIGGGMGPFLSTWLTGAEHWPPGRIGIVLSAGLIAGMLLATPAGALIDRIGRPRAMLAASCVMIMGGTLAMFVVHGLWPILAAQVIVAGGGALGGPSLIALTMATIGKDGFPRQQGINQAATHAGNVVAAALVWAAAFAIGPRRPSRCSASWPRACWSCWPSTRATRSTTPAWPAASAARRARSAAAPARCSATGGCSW